MKKMRISKEVKAEVSVDSNNNKTFRDETYFKLDLNLEKFEMKPIYQIFSFSTGEMDGS